MKTLKTYESFIGKKASEFIKSGKFSDKNIEHYNRAKEYIKGMNNPTLEEVVEVLKNMGGIRIPHTDNKMKGMIGNLSYDTIVEDLAKQLMADIEEEGGYEQDETQEEIQDEPQD